MKRNHTVIAVALMASFAHGCSEQVDSDSEAKTQSRSGFPTAAETDGIAKLGVVERDAVDALREMSDFLMTARTLEVKSEGSLDVVTKNGQRIQLDGTTNYKIRRPGFVIDYDSDIKRRRFVYDGRTFTVNSPELGFYATVPAPATNREVLDMIYDKFGIALPLEDLFRWGDGSRAARLQALESAYEIGTATIDGVPTDHYAFREKDLDWEVWIQHGAQPFPRKLVIVDRTDPARPTFTARLEWKMNPAFADADFKFVPGPDAKRIKLASFRGSGG